MLVYLYFRFAPFTTMAGFQVYGTFENEPGEL